MPVKLRFANDSDALRFEPSLDKWFPRLDKTGNLLRSWDTQHQLAMDELDRRLRSRKAVDERFDLGRLGLRSREDLRDCAAALMLHFCFVAMDVQGDDTGFYHRKASYYWSRGASILEASAIQMDYDADNDGTISEDEENRPAPTPFIRG